MATTYYRVITITNGSQIDFCEYEAALDLDYEPENHVRRGNSGREYHFDWFRSEFAAKKFADFVWHMRYIAPDEFMKIKTRYQLAE